MRAVDMRKTIATVLLVLGATLICAGPAGRIAAGELIDGGSFESGDFTAAWVHGAARGNQTNPSWADHEVVLDLSYAGDYSALIGFKYTQQRRNRYGFFYQDISIPADISSATLYFFFRQQGYDGANYDPFRVTIRNRWNTTLATVVDYSFSEWNNQFKDSGWIEDDGVGPAGYDLSPWAGQTIRIHFMQENTTDDLYETWAFVDDVSVIFKKYVDLAADGNGYDIFGDPGTGGGGTSTRSGKAGETVSYQLDIENEGLDTDSYTISVSPPSGWTAVLTYGGTDHALPWVTPGIPAGTKITARAKLTSPPGEPIGGYRTVVDAVSTTSGGRFDSAELLTNIVPSDHLTDLAIDSNGLGVIDPYGGGGISFREVGPDTIVDYSIELLNAGLLVDSFKVHFRAPSPFTAAVVDGGTTYTGFFNTAGIDPADTWSCTFRVTVPSALVGGDYSSYLYAMSLTDTLRKDGVRAVTRVAAPKIDVIISGSGDGIIDMTGSGLGGSSTIAGRRGTVVYFPLIFQNEGAVTDSFRIDWDAPGNGWSAVVKDGVSNHPLPWTTPAFEPFSGKFYSLGVSIPNNQAYDTYISILDIVSLVDGSISESVTAGITVASGNEVDIIVDGNGSNTYGPLGTGLGGSSIHTANPGDTVYFSVEIENEGGENLFDVQWGRPSGWEVVIGDSTSSLSAVRAGMYMLEVRIPDTCPGGTFDIILDAMKTNKKFFLDSMRGRVVVNPLRVVDALIDGNGDEIFGAPGTGGGGSSAQGAIGGRTVNFTVELQNQGGSADSYIALWNTIAGWTASLGGQPSPLVTSSVGAGGSILLTFEVAIPVSAAEGDYDYYIDVVSTNDSTCVESIRARIHINPPPRLDLVIDGNGAFDTAPSGTGEGGRAVLFQDPGSVVTAQLEIFNRGGFPDSFRIAWDDPPAWPAGSIVLSRGGSDYTAPHVTSLIAPGNSLLYTVTITVPVGAAGRNRFIIDGTALSRVLEDSVLLEIVTTAFVAGRVFDDADHDGEPGPGEAGWPGVILTLGDPSSPLTAVTDGSGGYIFEVTAGISRDIVETTPSGMISLTPDTVSIGIMSAGDTVFVDFADVRAVSIAPESDASGPSGGVIDIPHVVTAGTAGQAVVSAALPAGWVDIWYRDVNGDGVLDGGDTRLTSANLDLDPAVAGRDIIPVIVRIFIPSQVAAGTVGVVTFTVEQTLSGTAIVSVAMATDRVTVLSSSSGMLRLVKNVDLSEATPGDILTYTIVFSNPGVEGVREIEIIDPVPAEVDLVLDAFGPGNDIEWMRGGVGAYLTADPLDPDEAMLDPSGFLHIVLSRQAPFTLESGGQGSITYRVRVR